MTLTAQIINDVATAVLALVGLVPILRKFGPKVTTVVKEVEKAEPVIEKVGTAIVHKAEDILKLPEFAALREKVTSVESSLKKQKVVAFAATALHAYETHLANLTDNQKATLALYIQTALSANGYDYSQAEILDGINKAQKFADDFKQTEAYKYTEALTQSLNALKKQSAVDTAPVQQPTVQAVPAAVVAQEPEPQAAPADVEDHP